MELAEFFWLPYEWVHYTFSDLGLSNIYASVCGLGSFYRPGYGLKNFTGISDFGLRQEFLPYFRLREGYNRPTYEKVSLNYLDMFINKSDFCDLPYLMKNYTFCY